MHRKVQVWIFDAAARKVLLLKLNRKRGGFWQPVTGGVEPREPSALAAAREAFEETGFQGRPRPTGYRFKFEGRWGPASEIVYALKLKHAARAPKLDPDEHTQARWVTPTQARRLVKFDSNRKGLQAALKIILPLLLLAQTLHAAQTVKVGPEPVAAHRLPSRQSEILETLGQGTDLRVSDQPFADARNVHWYKVRLSQGQTAYVEARGLAVSASLQAEALRMGIAPETVASEPRKEYEWSMHFRLAAVGGAMIFPTTGAAVGGDAEFSLNTLLHLNGYLRRLLAIAVSFTAIPWQTPQYILAGGPVFRIYSSTLMEPEIRVRAGYDFSAQTFVMAPSFGYRLQLGTNPKIHFTWFWDLGCWLGPVALNTDPPRVAPYLLSGFGLSF